MALGGERGAARGALTHGPPHVTGPDGGSTMRRLATALAGAAVALMLAAAVVGAVDTVRDSGARAGKNSRLDFADREIAWGNGWMLSQNGLYAARSLIPAGADYDVVLGDASRFADPFTYRSAEGYLRYWLMPRYERSGATWVVCYRCDRSALGDHAVLWEDVDAGVAIIRRSDVQGS